jgi:hypothetical protein
MFLLRWWASVNIYVNTYVFWKYVLCHHLSIGGCNSIICKIYSLLIAKFLVSHPTVFLQVCSYPFTTRGILMGHIVSNHERFQVEPIAFLPTMTIEPLDLTPILLPLFFIITKRRHPSAGYGHSRTPDEAWWWVKLWFSKHSL